jgi:BolA protein
MSDTVALLQAALQQLAPEHLEIHDDSAAHAGHAGAFGRRSLRCPDCLTRFAGLNSVARHRLVYATLGDLMKTRVHALAIRALTPEEL